MPKESFVIPKISFTESLHINKKNNTTASSAIMKISILLRFSCSHHFTYFHDN